jgi:N-acetylglucosaminyldiphosphoundecaprenol N-acetyl-beta-D-mannosaminyltransferase
MPDSHQQILGIRFYIGSLGGALNLTRQGGLVVAPSGPVLANLPNDAAEREALESSDLALTDSGLLILLWRVLKHERLPRISGLHFLQGLIRQADFRQPGATFWVMPSAKDAQANIGWLNRQGIDVSPKDQYLAPLYPDGRLEDHILLTAIERQRPQFVILNLGGGVQERLGYFLRARLTYRPAIICTGAAIAFLSGRQANIPPWADRLFLGWLLRCLQNPAKFVPRYWKAVRLVPLLLKHGCKQVKPHAIP